MVTTDRHVRGSSVACHPIAVIGFLAIARSNLSRSIKACQFVLLKSLRHGPGWGKARTPLDLDDWPTEAVDLLGLDLQHANIVSSW